MKKMFITFFMLSSFVFTIEASYSRPSKLASFWRLYQSGIIDRTYEAETTSDSSDSDSDSVELVIIEELLTFDQFKKHINNPGLHCKQGSDLEYRPVTEAHFWKKTVRIALNELLKQAQK